MAKTIYCNLDDDIAKLTARMKGDKASEVTLVFPKQSLIFADGVNLKMLKKQADLLGKQVSILTMDERGQMYAKDAGFEVKFLAKTKGGSGMGDIRVENRVSTTPKIASEPKKVTFKKPLVGVKKPSIAKAKPQFPKFNDNVFVEETTFPDFEPQKKSFFEPRQIRKISWKKALSVILTVVIVLAILLGVVILPSARVVIYAKTEPVARDIKLDLSSSVTQTDEARLVLPATVVDQEVTVDNKFSSTGKKEVGSKAQGQVYIYNLTGQPLNLRSSTTTLTYNGKSYVFSEDQNGIKPVTQESIVNNPSIGHLASITAVEGGEASNLVSGVRLEITNQILGSKPQQLYARTYAEITGGNSRFLSIVTEEDKQNSEKSLVTLAIGQINSQLSLDNLVLPDKGFTTEVLESSIDQAVGTESPTFTGKIKLHVKGLAFNAKALQELLRRRVGESLPDSKTLQDQNKDKVTYSVKVLDTNAGTAVMVAHFESVQIASIDQASLIKELRGKGQEQARDLLLAKPEIARVEVYLKPAWQNSLPRFASKIILEEQY